MSHRERVLAALRHQVLKSPNSESRPMPSNSRRVRKAAEAIREVVSMAILADLKERFDLTMVFISHDLSVVYEICDRVAVMKDGKIVELGPATELYANPSHPYTAGLINAIPRLDGTLPRAG